MRGDGALPGRSYVWKGNIQHHEVRHQGSGKCQGRRAIAGRSDRVAQVFEMGLYIAKYDDVVVYNEDFHFCCVYQDYFVPLPGMRSQASYSPTVK